MMGTVIRTIQNNNRCGFTMVEVICVIIIIGIVSSIALPAIDNFRASDRCKAEASILVNYIRQAKYQAMQDNRFYRIKFATGENDDSNVFFVDAYEGNEKTIAAAAGNDSTNWASIADEEEVSIDAGVEVDLSKMIYKIIYFKPDGYLYHSDDYIIPEERVVFKYGNAAVAVDINALGVISSESIATDEVETDDDIGGYDDKFFDDKYNLQKDTGTYTGTETDD